MCEIVTILSSEQFLCVDNDDSAKAGEKQAKKENLLTGTISFFFFFLQNMCFYCMESQFGPQCCRVAAVSLIYPSTHFRRAEMIQPSVTLLHHTSPASPRWLAHPALVETNAPQEYSPSSFQNHKLLLDSLRPAVWYSCKTFMVPLKTLLLLLPTGALTSIYVVHKS